MPVSLGNTIQKNLAQNGDTLAVGTGNTSSLGLQITGTWTGTLSFQATMDGVNWFAVLAYPINGSTGVISGTGVTSATANGQWLVPCAGYAQTQVIATAAMTGSATVNLLPSIVSQLS